MSDNCATYGFKTIARTVRCISLCKGLVNYLPYTFDNIVTQKSKRTTIFHGFNIYVFPAK